MRCPTGERHGDDTVKGDIPPATVTLRVVRAYGRGEGEEEDSEREWGGWKEGRERKLGEESRLPMT